MSPQSSLSGMPGSTKKEKHYANSRAHRGSIVVSHAGSKKSKKDTDTESVSSETSTVVPPPPPKPQCPLRPYMEVMFESDDGEEKKKSLCPLRRVKLSHTIPLCIFVMINMCLLVVTLLITGTCRLSAAVLDWGRKQPKDVENVIYTQTINYPDFSAFTFLAMAAITFLVTICYGPDWMRTAFQVCTTGGFFVGLSMTLLAKKESSTAAAPLTTPTTPAPADN